MRVDIEGAIITSDIVAVLKDWQQSAENVADIHVEKLCKLQDFFCRLLINDCPDVDNDIINQFLMDIINLKDDLKMFNMDSICNQTSPDNN